MPNINDIVQVAESLEKSPVLVVADRCVAVRNRNAACRLCVEACQVDAIEISANKISLDAGACMACGACTSVCPTEALAPLKPTDAELARAAAEASAGLGGHAVFACARISSRRLADPRLYAEVPCLARMEESIVLDLVAHGADELSFVDGDCGTCKYRACVPFIDATVQGVNDMLAAQGSSVRARRVSSFPAEALVDDSRGLFGSTRRGFISEAAGMAKETALAAARTTLEQDLGIKKAEEPIGQRLRVTEDGSMPRLDMPRHERTINAMDAIGLPVAESLVSRRFASLSIDVGTCNACGMCAVFCTTGALSRADGEGASSEVRELEFSACECVQCRLCSDVCWKGALSISPEVPTAQLFDFEPVTFDLHAAVKPKSKPFGV